MLPVTQGRSLDLSDSLLVKEAPLPPGMLHSSVNSAKRDESNVVSSSTTPREESQTWIRRALSSLLCLLAKLPLIGTIFEKILGRITPSSKDSSSSLPAATSDQSRLEGTTSSSSKEATLSDQSQPLDSLNPDDPSVRLKSMNLVPKMAQTFFRENIKCRVQDEKIKQLVETSYDYWQRLDSSSISLDCKDNCAITYLELKRDPKNEEKRKNFEMAFAKLTLETSHAHQIQFKQDGDDALKIKPDMYLEDIKKNIGKESYENLCNYIVNGLVTCKMAFSLRGDYTDEGVFSNWARKVFEITLEDKQKVEQWIEPDNKDSQILSFLAKVAGALELDAWNQLGDIFETGGRLQKWKVKYATPDGEQPTDEQIIASSIMFFFQGYRWTGTLLQRGGELDISDMLTDLESEESQ